MVLAARTRARLAGVAAVVVIVATTTARAGTGDAAAVPQTAASPPAPHVADEVLVHDHAPRHGGVVGMAGQSHVEIVLAGNVLRVYLSDLHRAPLSLNGVTGEVVLRNPNDPSSSTTLRLNRGGDALEAPLPTLDGPTVDVRVELTTASGPLLIEFTLPVNGTPHA